MNILIVGEFSGFAKQLKNGFLQLGHKVTIVHTGDDWKKIKGDDLDITYTRCLFIGKYAVRGTRRLASPFIRNKVLGRIRSLYPDGPDLIIVINYRFLSSSVFQPGVPVSYIKKMAKQGAKLVMSMCGSDPAGKYVHPEYYKMIESAIPLIEKRFDFLIRNSDIIIPTIYDYYDAIKQYCAMRGLNDANIHKPIPLPITMDKECSIKSCVNKKIVIFHGIIRPVAKGTSFIMEAMEKLQKDYQEKVICICKGGMPFDEYVKVFEDVDILVDQTYGNGWGVNAAIGAMKGKCVLAPCGDENAISMDIPNIPFVKIGPDSNQIYQVLEALIKNPSKIDNIKKQSRAFIENYCKDELIAQRYLQSLGL